MRVAQVGRAVALSVVLFALGCGGPSPGPFATCTDGAQSGDETDVDCGGACTACGPGKVCVGDADCATGRCVASVCVAALEDECADEVDDCDEHALCVDTAEGFTCACESGWSGDGVTCADVDECADGSAGCDAHASCVNGAGGFTCACDAGWTGDGVTCADFDECAGAADPCDAHATCVNDEGGFACGCDAGWSGDGVTCVDIDECADGSDACSVFGTCTNTDGAYGCGCNAGYAGDGFSCVDVDECAAGTAGCSLYATCTNRDGGYDCVCNVGFAGSGVTCTDVDECAGGSAACHADASCTNSVGAYTCECDAGFSGDGLACARARTCAELLALDPTAASGSHFLDPDGDGLDPVAVDCEMTLLGGGWTRVVTAVASALAPTVARRYLYLSAGRWYRSPCTTVAWSWTAGAQVTGTYEYFNTSVTSSFVCAGSSERPAWGVGCSRGGGPEWKVLPAYVQDAALGTSTVCQDQPNAFGGGVCQAGVKIYVRDGCP